MMFMAIAIRQAVGMIVAKKIFQIWCSCLGWPAFLGWKGRSD
jgi:hypothetical protein